MDGDVQKVPLRSNDCTDMPCKDDLYKHDTIVNLYNDIKLYDKQAAAQVCEIDESVDVEVREEILKSTNARRSVFRRPVLLIAVLIIAVAIFILCPFLQLATDSDDEAPSKVNDTTVYTDIRETEETVNLVQVNNLWDG